MANEQKPFVPKTAYDFQKLKLEKLMANPEKPVIIPETPKDRKGYNAPEFVRNVMGSSAGAGSGEFHVYRHLRRKEYTRQKMIEEMSEQEKLDIEFQFKIEENQKKAEERTSKKRTKRLKRKERAKKVKATKVSGKSSGNQEEIKASSEESSEEESSDNENALPANKISESSDTSSQEKDLNQKSLTGTS